MATLVTQTAPDFLATAVMPDGTLDEHFRLSSLRGRYVVLFFYPLDFTFVCPSEILAHDNRIDRFTELGCQVVGVSIDSQFTHLAWRRTQVEQGGIGPIRFPLVADLKREIAAAYGVLHPAGVALRASFLIDRNGTVQHQVVNNLPLGRDVDEMLRVVEALQFTEEHGEVCPAGWRKGRRAMRPDPAGVAAWLAEHGRTV